MIADYCIHRKRNDEESKEIYERIKENTIYKMVSTFVEKGKVPQNFIDSMIKNLDGIFYEQVNRKYDTKEKTVEKKVEGLVDQIVREVKEEKGRWFGKIVDKTKAFVRKKIVDPMDNLAISKGKVAVVGGVLVSILGLGVAVKSSVDSIKNRTQKVSIGSMSDDSVVSVKGVVLDGKINKGKITKETIENKFNNVEFKSPLKVSQWIQLRDLAKNIGISDVKAQNNFAGNVFKLIDIKFKTNKDKLTKNQINKIKKINSDILKKAYKMTKKAYYANGWTGTYYKNRA